MWIMLIEKVRVMYPNLESSLMFTEVIIEPEDVNAALCAIVEARPLRRSNPLLRCLLTVQILRSPDFPGGAYAELSAVYEVLEVSFLRVLDHEVRCIRKVRQEHFDTQNPYRFAHQLLYFRYMRPELGFSTKSLAEIAGYSDRTTRRRLQDGIQHLTLDIIRRETTARQVMRQALQTDTLTPDLAVLQKLPLDDRYPN
jgi:hypothetical protein